MRVIRVIGVIRVTRVLRVIGPIRVIGVTSRTRFTPVMEILLHAVVF